MPTVQDTHVDRIPGHCPLCLHAVHPDYIEKSGRTLNAHPIEGVVFEAAYRCPRIECRSLFLAYFNRPSGGVHRFYKSIPVKFVAPNISQRIAKLSPQFVKVYSQAKQALASELDEIAGMGMRKALEFLIKDYCISKNQAAEEEIKKNLLGAVIKKFVTDSNIKVCAERATWLGNDETHYERRWTDHDIADLERLIHLTCNWIISAEMTAEYLASMPQGGPPAATP